MSVATRLPEGLLVLLSLRPGGLIQAGSLLCSLMANDLMYVYSRLPGLTLPPRQLPVKDRLCLYVLHLPHWPCLFVPK